ncbi:hypothetical protein [Halobacillus campisalis]|uniref:Uncharacterized protein n=1 Tax=Halobacillus campisalis TaxID=435909 RepID=A0ABW2K8W7_9BACI
MEASVNVRLEAPFCLPREQVVTGECTPLIPPFQCPVTFPAESTIGTDEPASRDELSKSQVESFCINN